MIVSFSREQSLEVVDRVVAPLPDRLRHEIVDAHDEHVLVVRAVEDADHPLRRACGVDAPEEVVRELGGRRLLEGDDVAPLRVDGAMTWRIVPSLPLVSIPCRTISTLCCAAP